MKFPTAKQYKVLFASEKVLSYNGCITDYHYHPNTIAGLVKRGLLKLVGGTEHGLRKYKITDDGLREAQSRRERLAEHMSRGRKIDYSKLVGNRFGQLTVIDIGAKGVVPVRCDCGAEGTVLLHNLKSGNSTSCGHDRPEHLRQKPFTRATIKSEREFERQKRIDELRKLKDLL